MCDTDTPPKISNVVKVNLFDFGSLQNHIRIPQLFLRGGKLADKFSNRAETVQFSARFFARSRRTQRLDQFPPRRFLFAAARPPPSLSE